MIVIANNNMSSHNRLQAVLPGTIRRQPIRMTRSSDDTEEFTLLRQIQVRLRANQTPDDRRDHYPPRGGSAGVAKPALEIS